MVTKSEAREMGRAARMHLTPSDRSAFDARIVKRLQTEINWAQLRRVMVFLPITRHHEINTWPLVEWLQVHWPHLDMYVPRVQNNVIDAVRVNLRTKYELTVWAVPEPKSGTLLANGERLDVVLTPLLAFDATGTRVGYGRGYFDRFFAAHDVKTVAGLSYAQQQCSQLIQAEPHDQRLDSVITEEGAIRF